MKHTAHKLFWVWDFEKEEKWLNEMAAKGMQLTDVGVCRYVFEEGSPGEYQYHLEWLRHFPSHPESISYIRFMEEAGAEHVGSFKKWVYFRKKTTDGAFRLFSDLDSRISHFRKIFRLTGFLFLGAAAYAVSLFWHGLLAWSFPMEHKIMLVIYGMLLGFLGFGFLKSFSVYRKLKQQRVIQE